jgi:hypothetical protein
MTTSAAVQESVYAGGSWRRPDGDVIEVFDPADGSVLANVGSASDAQVHESLLAAREAQRDWARTPSVVRGQCLRSMADVILANQASCPTSAARAPRASSRRTSPSGIRGNVSTGATGPESRDRHSRSPAR